MCIQGTGELRAHYEYDAWGNVISVTDQNGNAVTSATHIGNLNPFRYRGYIYDNETGLYYLQSRYYDPVTGRFINADSVCDTQNGSPLSVNMFAYCCNNFINLIDKTGHDGTYWAPVPTCPIEKRIIDLKLTTEEELSEYYYAGMYKNNGYEVYTYNNICYWGDTMMTSNILEFHALTKTYEQWRTYSYGSWGWYEDTANAFLTVASYLLLFVSFLSGDYVSQEYKDYVDDAVA